MSLISIPVFLNGARDYVQGTQLLARASEVVASGSAESMRLHSAGFHSITDREVSITLADELPDAADAALGDAVFRTEAGARKFVRFWAGENEAPRKTISPNCSYRQSKADPANPLNGTWELSGVADLEDLLNAIVQSIKTQHENLGQQVSNVWFTGLRSAAIPVFAPIAGGSCELQITHIRSMNSNDRTQSLQKIELAGDGVAPMSGMVTFAYLTGEI